MQYKTILLGILLLATSCTRLKLEKELEQIHFLYTLIEKTNFVN